MIIKERDSLAANIAALEHIKGLATLTPDQASAIDTELRLLRSGEKGEQESAYLIDFHFGQLKNWIVIHDVRLKWGDRVAQIDHILMNRFLDCYVLETKHYARGIKVTETGEFLIWSGKEYRAIASPIYQNQRHVEVLNQLLRESGILPKRFGISLVPRFLPYILVSPTSRIMRPPAKAFNTDMLIKADAFYQQTQARLDEVNMEAFTATAKLVSRETLYALGRQLVHRHTPHQPDYYAKFGIQSQSAPEAQPLKSMPTSPAAAEPPSRPRRRPNSGSTPGLSSTPKSKYFCWTCKQSISPNVATFCFSHAQRFQGKAYCLTCQQSFPS